MDNDHVSDDRVSNLEEAVAKLQAQDLEKQNKLDLILASVTQLLQNKATFETPLPTEPPVLSPPVDLPKTHMVQPAAPLDFDGDWAKEMAFLNSCQTYI